MKMKKICPKHIAETIEGMARDKNLTMPQLCEISEVSSVTWWRFKKGQDIKLSTLNKLIRAAENHKNGS